MNAVVLVSNAYKAASQARKNADKPESKRDFFPVMSTLLLRTHDGHLLVTPFCWGDKTERAKRTEAIPARVESDFAACVPARAFVDWLRASQLTTHEKKIKASEQIQLTLDGLTLIVTAGNTRARFNCLSADEFPAVN